jgi:outer membrane protein assembly factor BamB
MFTSDGVLCAVDAAGKTKWSVPFGKNSSGRSTPAVRDGVVYIIASLDTTDQYDRPSSESFLFALDAGTGAEKWRYKHSTLEFLVTPEAIFSTTRDRSGYEHLIAFDRKTGRERFEPVNLSYVDELNRKQSNPILNLIEAGPYVVGSSRLGLMAFEKASGRVAWTMPADSDARLRPHASAGTILYFEGNLPDRSARWPSGTLHALDVTNQKVIWSYRREGPQTEASWRFNDVLPIDGGLWAGAYKALVKLQ